MSEPLSDGPTTDMRIDRFQFVSRVETLDVTKATLTALARAPDDHSIFEGHFPSHPLMPGVLLTELMAQTCGFLLLSLNGFGQMPFLAALKEVKLREFVRPGTELLCTAERVHPGSGYAVLNASVALREGQKRVCNGVLMFRIVPFPSDELRQHMKLRADEVGLSLSGGDVVIAEKART